MATKPIPTPEQLRQLVRYEADTGKLFWLPRDVSWFTDGWNTVLQTPSVYRADGLKS